MQKTITVLPGDGIGQEVVEAATKVLDKVAERYGHQFEYRYGDIGGTSIDKIMIHSHKKPSIRAYKVMACCSVQWEAQNGII